MNLLLNKPFFRLSGKFIPACMTGRMHFAGSFRAKSGLLDECYLLQISFCG